MREVNGGGWELGKREKILKSIGTSSSDPSLSISLKTSSKNSGSGCGFDSS
jgi:hypothetical protein